MDETQADRDWGEAFGERLNEFINKPENLPGNLWQHMQLEYKLVAFYCVQLTSFAAWFLHKMDAQEAAELLAVKFFDWNNIIMGAINNIIKMKGPKKG